MSAEKAGKGPKRPKVHRDSLRLRPFGRESAPFNGARGERRPPTRTRDTTIRLVCDCGPSIIAPASGESSLHAGFRLENGERRTRNRGHHDCQGVAGSAEFVTQDLQIGVFSVAVLRFDAVGFGRVRVRLGPRRRLKVPMG